MLDGQKLCGGNADFIRTAAALPDVVSVRAEQLAEEGKTPLFFARGGKLLGVIAVADVLKPDSPQAIRALGRGLVDLCVITTPARLESTMRRTLLMPFQEILIAGRNFEFLQGRRWALKELQQYPLICLGSETMTYAFYNQFYLSNNLVLQPDTEAATTDQVVPLVKSGLGLGYVPQNFAKDALAAGDVFTIQLKEEIPTRHVVLVQDGGRVPNAAAREFARMLNSSVTQQNAP